MGNHSLSLPLDIGTSHSADPSFEPDPAIRAAVAQLSGPQLPVFLVSGCPNPFNPGQPESFYTSDPGKALISGKCGDFNRLKGPGRSRSGSWSRSLRVCDERGVKHRPNPRQEHAKT